MLGNAYSVKLDPISRGYEPSRNLLNRKHQRARSVVAKAAYDTRDKFTDPETGEVFDYRQRGEVNGVFTQLPAKAPRSWRDNPERLATEMSLAEHRVDAQEGFALRYALPLGLTPNECRQLAKNIAERTASDQHLAAIVSLHLDPHNPHVHQIISTRFVTEAGFGDKYRRIRQRGYLYDTRETVAVEGARMLRRAAAARPEQADSLLLAAARWEHGHERYEKQIAFAAARGDREFVIHGEKRLRDFNADKKQRTRAKWAAVPSRRKAAVKRSLEVEQAVKKLPAQAATDSPPLKPVDSASIPNQAITLHHSPQGLGREAPMTSSEFIRQLSIELAGMETELQRLKSLPERQWNHGEIERVWAAIVRKRREIENEKAAQRERKKLDAAQGKSRPGIWGAPSV